MGWTTFDTQKHNLTFSGFCVHGLSEGVFGSGSMRSQSRSSCSHLQPSVNLGDIAENPKSRKRIVVDQYSEFVKEKRG
jgi:hypothetical protein